jgi:energy-coupling factor transport system ATP-binding protein
MKIKFENVCYHYNAKLPEKNLVLKNINLEITDGEFIGIIGPSGSGKTTLLQHFTGLLRPTSGDIYIDDQNIWNKNYPLSELRKRIGLVFQFPESQLFEETVYSDVAYGPTMLKLPDDEINMRVNEALKLVGMRPEKINNRSPHRLSEGEKRRVAIAGVLAMAPDVLVLDEPTACLDPAGVKLMIQILKQLHENRTTIIMITHSLDVVIQLAPRIIVLNQGQICYDGKRDTVFTDNKFLESVDLEPPRIVRLCQYLQKLNVLSQTNLFSIDDVKKQVETIDWLDSD